jgi:hypothetical protein
MTHLATAGLHRAVMHSARAVAVDCLWVIFPWAQPRQASRPCLLASAFLKRRALLQRGASTLPVSRLPAVLFKMLLVGMRHCPWSLFCMCGRLHICIVCFAATGACALQLFARPCRVGIRVCSPIACVPWACLCTSWGLLLSSWRHDMCLDVWVSLLGFGPYVYFFGGSRHCMHAIVTVQHDRLAIDSLNGQLFGGNYIVVKPDAPVAAGLFARCTVCTRCCVRMFCSGDDYVRVFCPCAVVASLALGECVASALGNGMGWLHWEGLCEGLCEGSST